MSLIIGLLWGTSALELVIDYAGVVKLAWFVILIFIFDSSGISFESSDVRVIA